MSGLTEQLRIDCDWCLPCSQCVKLMRKAAAEIERLTRERDELKCRRDSLTGWWVAKECENGSLILQSHTGERKHVWQCEPEERKGEG